jgi:hypothetical protein
MHLASGGNVSDHAFPDLEAMTGAAKLAAAAAVSAHQGQFAALFVVKIDVRIQASEGMGDLVHDLIDEPVEVKDGADFLSGFLQLEKLLDLIEIKGVRA